MISTVMLVITPIFSYKSWYTMKHWILWIHAPLWATSSVDLFVFTVFNGWKKKTPSFESLSSDVLPIKSTRWPAKMNFASVAFDVCCFLGFQLQGVINPHHHHLGGETSNMFYFPTPIWGRWTQFDSDFFQMDWNFQPSDVWKKNSITFHWIRDPYHGFL